LLFSFNLIGFNAHARFDEIIIDEPAPPEEIPLIDPIEFDHIVRDDNNRIDQGVGVNEFVCPCIISTGISFSSAAIMGSFFLAYYLKANGYGITEDESAYYTKKIIDKIDKIDEKVNSFFDQYKGDAKPSTDVMLDKDSLDDPKFLLP